MPSDNIFYTKKVNKRFYRRKQIAAFMLELDKQITKASPEEKKILSAVRNQLHHLKLLREQTTPRYLNKYHLEDPHIIYLKFKNFIEEMHQLYKAHKDNPLVQGFIEYARLSLAQREQTLMDRNKLTEEDISEFALFARIDKMKEIEPHLITNSEVTIFKKNKNDVKTEIEKDNTPQIKKGSRQA